MAHLAINILVADVTFQLTTQGVPFRRGW
jgi:hypothetical protein